MGGLAATHLGRSGVVDFMLVDRSFRNLSLIAKELNTALPPLLRFLTLWDDPDCSVDYSISNCYKVIAQDPKDDIVEDSCSLKTGVALSLIRLELESMQLSTLGAQKRISMSQYYHILNRQETEILFKALENIFYQVLEFEIDNRAVRRRFCMVTDSEQVDSSRATTERVLNSRLKRTQKYDQQFQKSFSSHQTDGNLKALSDFMMSDSFLEPDGQSPDDNQLRLATDRFGEEYDSDKHLTSPSPGRDESILDESIY